MSSREVEAGEENQSRHLILMTPYPVKPGHTLISIMRLEQANWRPEMRASAAHIAEGDNAGIIINKPASIMDYNKNQAGQKERQQPPSAKMSFKVFLINSESGKLTLEHRTLRFWLENSPIITAAAAAGLNNNNNTDDYKSVARAFANIKQESSHLAQAYFCQLIGSKPDDDFPKNYVAFLMKLMRLLKTSQFSRITRMEVELRQLAHEEHAKPPSRASSLDGGSQSGESSGRGSPLTSQRVLDIIESSYPNPISIKEICSTTQANESAVRQLVEELAEREKINSTDDGQHYTRTTKPIDTKINLVKQMPKVIKSQQPVIAIITAQYCEKLAVDSMISEKETFVRYRTTSAGGIGGQLASAEQGASANYVYTLGNIGDHRVVSTKLTSIGHSRGALIAAGNATTRLLGTFPEIEYVFLVGCGGGVVNYTDFNSHVRLGDVVVSHLPDVVGDGLADNDGCLSNGNGSSKSSPTNQDYVYVHCKPKQQDHQQQQQQRRNERGNIPVSYSTHKNLKRAMTNGGDTASRLYDDHETPEGGAGATINDDIDEQRRQSQANQDNSNSNNNNNNNIISTSKPLEYEQCHFRLWRPANLDLQELSRRLWLQGLANPKHRIWEYYIDEGIKSLGQQDIEACRPPASTDKLFMSIGLKDTIEVSHPEAAEDELDLRRDGRPMCHFGPIGSGKPANSSEPLKQRMISEFGLRAFDSEFDPVVESIYGNCKESYIMIRGISDYRDGHKRKEWQQYSALVAAAFMKSIIVNLKPLD